MKYLKKSLIILLACASLFAIVGCNAKSTVTKQVKVVATGKAVSPQAKSMSRAVAMELASGGVAINGEAVDLKPVAGSGSNSNATEFEATVNVEVPAANPMIRLSATPAVGFVFDEWELDKAAMKADGLSKKDVKLTDAQEESFTIDINADHVKYYVATFEPGFYVDLANGDDTAGDGSYLKPFQTIAQALTAIETKIAAGNASADDEDDDYDEFVLVVSGSSSDDVSIDQDVSVSIKGGYASDWSNGAITELGAIRITASETDDIEISNVKMTSLSSTGLLDELTGCEIGKLTIDGLDAVVIANTTITGAISLPAGSSLVNCVIKGTEGSPVTAEGSYSYFHCLMPSDISKANDSVNNILIGGTAGVVGADYVVANWTSFTGYKTEDATLIAALKQATGLDEAAIEALDENRGIDDDFFEEDITGFERLEIEEGETGYWSYGPYEYNGR